VNDWVNKREQNAKLVAIVTTQDKTITIGREAREAHEKTIEIQKQTIETWKEHYERLRWQQRTTPPNQPRKGVK
jgi:hypothetical protein